MGFYTTMILKRLGLDGIIDTVYSIEDHSLPEGMDKKLHRSRPPEFYELQVTKIVTIPENGIKPNPKLLLRIIDKIGLSKEQCIYVGDSLEHDIEMAQQAGVKNVWAKYGKKIEPYKYQLLKDVTHWKSSNVDRESSVDSGNEIQATYEIEKFSDLLKIFDFSPNKLSDVDKTLFIELWKKTIDVQQHFNEIEMKIRSLFVTIFTGLLALYGYFVKSGDEMSFVIDSFFTFTIISITFLFYFTDRYWYHRLLNGAVKQGIDLEKIISKEISQINLTGKIKENSPIKVYKWIVCLRNVPIIGFLISLFINDPNFKEGRIHSDAKIEIFYKSVVLGILIMWAISFYNKVYSIHNISWI